MMLYGIPWPAGSPGCPARPSGRRPATWKAGLLTITITINYSLLLLLNNITHLLGLLRVLWFTGIKLLNPGTASAESTYAQSNY